MNGITLELADFVSNTHYNDLPEEVVEKMKLWILDTLGVSIAAVGDPSIKIMFDYLNGREGNSTIIGYNKKADSIGAALANGTAAHALDFDDWHSAGTVHPGCVVIPAALALAEEKSASGKDFLTSVVLGYEVMIRVGLGVSGGLTKRGFHPTGTVGPFGATAATAKLFGLEKLKVANAFGIASSQSSGLMEFLKSGSWVKRMHAGWAAQNGIVAASLANLGYTGPLTAIEGEYGFIRTHSDIQTIKRILPGLGVDYETLNIQPKAFPCCSEAFSSIEAALELVHQYSLRAEDIENIKIRSFTFAINELIEPRDLKINPSTLVDAQFSIPFNVALAISRGGITIKNYTDEILRDPEVLCLAKKVEGEVDPDLDEMFPGQAPAIVEITTKDVVKYDYRVDCPKGTPANPFTPKELKDKFRQCSKSLIGDCKVERVIRTVENLEKINRISELTHLLAPNFV